MSQTPPRSTRDFRPSRRGFLQGGAAGALLVGATATIPAHAQQAELVPLDRYLPEYFTSAEWAFVLAATARLIPSEGDGPGAIETRVPVFIDRQMTSDFGTAAQLYMVAPHFPDADPLLGYQSPLAPRDIYRQGIAAVDAWCRSTRGMDFADMSVADQDDTLTRLDKNEVPLAPEIREFFTLLLQNTKEGYFADPMYGGNHGMAAWVYLGFPGARASFLDWVDQHDRPYPLGPVSISGERA